MELRQLEYFVAVAEEGGFGRAAQRLTIVQSAVSQQIARLEREFGVRLFDRSTRHVRLTGAGERLLMEARAVLAAADRVREVATDIAAGADGVLRVGTLHAPDDRVYRALNELAGIAPRLRVRPRRLPPAERLAAVRAGELDAALVRALRHAPGLEVLEVWDDPLYVALPAAHPLAAHPGLRLDQLGRIPLRLAARAANPAFHDLITESCRAAGIAPPAGPPFTTLQQTLAEIASGTPSWTVFYAVSTLPRMHGVAIVPLTGLSVTTALAVPPGPPTPAVRHLLEALRRTPIRAA
ncbi:MULTISPECIES: LysR family transcriptional regulator [unclassified Nocardia]|uniref:LysR family transcriptional regulator n=1 Tax=unclassified Nocardia TaxID=2637762 RepID=UPI00278C6867|nr:MULTISPECIES: LysR family transcriptional regulator [unclassified Nocardia]